MAPQKLFHNFKMAAINTALVARDTVSHLAKRNWAGQEAGVIVVFCIVFIVAVGVGGLFISKAITARRLRNQGKATA
ncbi:hypothetical protein B0T19DRAFT_441721 [Cercophora scortea]|uniref:Uncharacterized protein n=1 Tax=Cercophora scortea TaxID=314031 RepID=A0AAE0IMC3_9PEZI|nr:hypothetical protein B0T19DRAFT_441721 [Cercophora scortea]